MLNKPLEPKMPKTLSFWVKHGSWTYCSHCYKLVTLRRLPRFKNKPITKPKNGCTCQECRYPTPTNDDIPNVLRNLSLPEICSLQPLTIHNGDYTRMENGYRQKGGIFRLKWSRLSVEEKLNTLPDIASRQRTRAPYHHLINDSESSYKEFVMWRDDSIQHGQQFNLYDYQQRPYVECCGLTYTLLASGVRPTSMVVVPDWVQKSRLSSKWTPRLQTTP